MKIAKIEPIYLVRVLMEPKKGPPYLRVYYRVNSKVWFQIVMNSGAMLSDKHAAKLERAFQKSNHLPQGS